MKITKTINNRDFEIFVNPDLGLDFIQVSMYEIVRPSWIIFRTKFIDSLSFWTADYATFEAGINTMIMRILDKEMAEKNLCTNWKKFSEKA